jgi:hypothetical protein
MTHAQPGPRARGVPYGITGRYTLLPDRKYDSDNVGPAAPGQTAALKWYRT